MDRWPTPLLLLPSNTACQVALVGSLNVVLNCPLEFVLILTSQYQVGLLPLGCRSMTIVWPL